MPTPREILGLDRYIPTETDKHILGIAGGWEESGTPWGTAEDMSRHLDQDTNGVNSEVFHEMSKLAGKKALAYGWGGRTNEGPVSEIPPDPTDKSEALVRYFRINATGHTMIDLIPDEPFTIQE